MFKKGYRVTVVTHGSDIEKRDYLKWSELLSNETLKRDFVYTLKEDQDGDTINFEEIEGKFPARFFEIFST